MKFILPALFLFVLGVGNIVVGSYKEWQYKQVYDELTELEPSPVLSSTLSRLQTTKQTSDRHAQRQLEANERLNLYRLVSFGGKSFIALSLLLFAIALTLRYLSRRAPKLTRGLAAKTSANSAANTDPKMLSRNADGGLSISR